MSLSYFDKIYVIHKPNEARKAAMEGQLARFGAVATEYVFAKPPANAFTMSNMRRAPIWEFAVNLSHIKAVGQAIFDGAERPLFLEDDVVFSDDAEKVLGNAIDTLDKYIWEVLYLGGHPCEPVVKVSDNLVRIGRFSFAESYSVNGLSTLKRLQDFWYDNIGQDKAMYDFILSRFAMEKGYCTFPVITNQAPGYSHIAQRNDDKAPLVAKGWLTNT